MPAIRGEERCGCGDDFRHLGRRPAGKPLNTGYVERVATAKRALREDVTPLKIVYDTVADDNALSPKADVVGPRAEFCRNQPVIAFS